MSLLKISELYDIPASQILCYHEFLQEGELTEDEIKVPVIVIKK